MNQHILDTTTPTAELAGVRLAYSGGEQVLRGLDWFAFPKSTPLMLPEIQNLRKKPWTGCRRSWGT